METLLADGRLDVNAKTKDGSTALHFCLSSRLKKNKRLLLMQMLIEEGADLNRSRIRCNAVLVCPYVWRLSIVSVSVFVCLSVWCLSVSLFVCLPVCLVFYLFVCLSVYLFVSVFVHHLCECVCLSVSLVSVCMFICLSACLFGFLFVCLSVSLFVCLCVCPSSL